MNERIIEIIEIIEENALMGTMPTRQMVEMMLGQHYRSDEIEEALTWMETYKNDQEDDIAFDISGEYRSIFVDPRAYEYLSKLVKQDIISEEYAEEILDYCLVTADENVTLERMIEIDQTMKHSYAPVSGEVFENYVAYMHGRLC